MPRSLWICHCKIKPSAPVRETSDLHLLQQVVNSPDKWNVSYVSSLGGFRGRQMLLFLRGSNAGHGATKRAGLFRGREHTALLCFPLWGRSLWLCPEKLILVPFLSHRQPLGQLPLKCLVKLKRVSQLQAAAVTCYQHATRLCLLEVCHQSIFVFYRINSLWLLRGCFPTEVQTEFCTWHKYRYKNLLCLCGVFCLFLDRNSSNTFLY